MCKDTMELLLLRIPLQQQELWFYILRRQNLLLLMQRLITAWIYRLMLLMQLITN